MRDPIKYVENKQNPKLISVDNLKDPINTEIQQQRVNNYSNRETELRSNTEIFYGIVWGEWYNGIKSIFRKNKYFEEKSDIFDCIWLLKQVKEVTSGLDVELKKL